MIKEDLLIAFEFALLSGKNIGVQSKTEKSAKVISPSLVKKLEDYVNSPAYQKLIQKDMEKLNKEKP